MSPLLTQSFHRLWLSQALSTLGDIWYILALVVTLYHLSGSATITALYPLLRVAGMTVGSVVAPLIMRKLRLNRLLTSSLGGQTLGLGLLTLYMLLMGNDSPNIAVLVGMVFGISILEGVAGPVRSSLVALTVPETSLLKANSVLAGVVETCSLAGWAFGSITVSWLGASQVLLLSTLLLGGACISSSMIKKVSSSADQTSALSWGQSLQEGWRIYFTLPKLRVLLWMDFWEGLFRGAFAGALLLVFVNERLHVGEVWWGWMNGANLGGFVLISILMSRLTDEKWNLGVMLTVGSGFVAALTLGFSFSTSPVVTLVVMFAIGAFQAIKNLAERTSYQTSVPTSELPPLFAAQSSLTSILYGVSLLLSGWIADTMGIQMLYIFASVGFALSFVGALAGRGNAQQTNRYNGTEETVK
ncbi:MFS transporter [Paenibacillus sp. GCM10012306]|uniref:MFS transporter n=1 Tax=Paenibacillus sp. GCM10012306 TaxID=3317342 RepID=UPI00360D162F